MDANVGFHDCLAAAEWTAKHIKQFGGDPERITVMGQSAGGAMINWATTLHGGKGKLPFQQVVYPLHRTEHEAKELITIGFHIVTRLSASKEHHRSSAGALPSCARGNQLY